MVLKKIRNVFSLLLIFTLSLLAVGCTGAGQSKEDNTIRIGFQVIPNTEAIAKANGWHEQTMKNTNVKWYSFDAGRDVNTALASNSIDIGLLGSTLVANGISKNIDYKVIWIADVIGSNEALVVKENAGIKSIQDLKGKKIAVTFGSTTQYALLGALKVNNIDPKEVNIVDMSPADMLAAWQRGDIDGGYVWEPTLQKMAEQGGRILITSGDLVEKGIVTADVVVVRSEFAKKHPELVVDYIRSEIRAYDLYKKNPEQAIQSVAKEFQLSNDEVKSMMNELIWVSANEQASDKYLGVKGNAGYFANTLKDTADFLKDQNIIQSVPSSDVFKEAVTPTFIETAQGNR